mgnify:FL=1
MGIEKFIVDEPDAALFAENLVEFNQGVDKRSIRTGETVRYTSGRVFEELTRHPPGKILPAGAFTHVVDAQDSFFLFDIGRYCSIARGTNITQGHHPLHSVTTSPYHYSAYYSRHLPEDLKYSGPYVPFNRDYGRGVIGNDVWIGAHCAIKSGITIGDGSVIASGSVVVKDVEPYTIVGGNPAKPIRLRFPQEIVDRFIALRWWSYSPESFRDINMFDVTVSLDEMEIRKERGDLVPFRPNRFKIVSGEIIPIPNP